MNVQVDDQRIHDQCDREERREQDAEDLDVAEQCTETIRADGIGHEAHDAERCKADDPLHDLRDRLREVVEHVLRRVTGRMERDASQAGPAEDANVVGIGHRVNRVVDDRKNQVVQDLDDAGRRRELRIGNLQVQDRRERKRVCDGNK